MIERFNNKNKISLLDRFLNWIEDLRYIRQFKDNVIYANKERDILIHKEEGIPILKVFIKGMLYNLPINVDISTEDAIQKTTDRVLALNMKILEVPELKFLLEEAEANGDYEKCAELRDLIKEKENGQTN